MAVQRGLAKIQRAPKPHTYFTTLRCLQPARILPLVRADHNGDRSLERAFAPPQVASPCPRARAQGIGVKPPGVGWKGVELVVRNGATGASSVAKGFPLPAAHPQRSALPVTGPCENEAGGVVTLPCTGRAYCSMLRHGHYCYCKALGRAHGTDLLGKVVTATTVTTP
eukprot:3422017-Rhodomonas_salina.2